MATQASENFVQQLYVSYYGRPAESEGLQYWADRADDEGQSAIVNAFGESQEFQDSYGDLSNEELVNNLYQQLFSRDADDAGLEYYTGVLESGDKSLSEIALTISNAAQGSDMDIRDARIEAADAYTAKAGAENYSVSTAKDLLQSIDATDTQGDLDAALAQIEDLPTQSAGEGETFTLTAETDIVTGTDGDDVFLAPDGSFQTFDQIDGGAGRDTLRVEAGDSVTGDISNVEVLSVEGDALTTVNAASIDGLERINFVDTETAPGVNNLSENQTVGFENSGADGTIFSEVTLAEGNTTVNVALNNSDVSIEDTGSTAKTLNLSSEGTSAFAASGNSNFASNLNMVSVAASGELTLSGGSFGVDVDGDVTFDASASTGNITVSDDASTGDVLDNVTNVIGGAGDDNFGALNAATSVEAGAGDDTINLADNDVKVTVDAGAGDDRIELGTKTLSDTSIDGGEGNDTVVIGSSTFSTQSYDAINTLQNIETVEFSADGVSVDASELDASALTFTGGSATVENLGADQTVVASAGAEAATAATTQTLNVEGDIADTVNVEASYNASGEEAGEDFSNTVTLTIADDSEVESADTLNLSGNGNIIFANGTVADGAADPVVVAGETFASVDASAMTGALTYSNVAGTKESITLGEDNGADILNVADGSTYGSMDVITNFDSTVDEDADAEGADVTADVLSDIFGGGNSATEVELGDDVTSLNGAFAAAAGSDADGYAFFNFEDNTYVFKDTGDSEANGEYDNSDFAIQIVGNHDLSSDNAAYNVNVA